MDSLLPKLLESGKGAMNLATGAMDSLLPKLLELLKGEYKLKKDVKEGVKSLETEMQRMHTVLREVAEVPRDQLDEQFKLWAGEVRELSFNIEDVVDKFLLRVDDGSETAGNSNMLKRLTEKMVGLFTKGMVGLFTKVMARHEIAGAIKEINKQVQEVANRRARYTTDGIVAKSAAATSIDPRLRALYTEVTELIGIVGKRDQELMKLLSEGDNVSKKKLKIISVVGFGGLGKTTLVKTVYDKIKGDFKYKAFVPVGQNATVKKVSRDILLDIGMYPSQLTMLDERQLINKLRQILENKRYLIVIDDIWDENLWEYIKLAFSDSNVGSRLITTTRKVSMSKLCCPSTNDSIYQMEPLSFDDSKRLFYKRVFSDESGCPREFEKVSIDILKKCGGVPLAIITMASLLAIDQRVKPEDEWNVLLQSIGRGLTEVPSVEEMRRILSFSYYDLPSHSKTCLLYLSMFPEQHEIRRDRLIWMWICESFIQCEKANTSLFETGEKYFNELVNRNLIQPVYGDEGMVYACRVHVMVLDLISSLSSKENFVTILNGTGDGMSSKSNVRRLSIQNASKEEHHSKKRKRREEHHSKKGKRKEEHQTTPLKSVSMLQVRSIALFEPAIGLMLPFSRFVVLRVLDLTGCDLRDQNHLNIRELGGLFHLRYLGLGQTGISELPEELGKLKFLLVLDLSGDFIKELSTVIKLRRLMCLLVYFKYKRLPDGLGNLTSMEVLRTIRGNSISIVKELGNMERLRELGILFDDLSLEMEEAFVESLGKMSNIQSLYITVRDDDYVPMDVLGGSWVAPQRLREFLIARSAKFSTLPTWIKRGPSHLLQLSILRIFVRDVRQEDLEILARLPALRCLSLRMEDPEIQRQLVVGDDGFRCLTSFELFTEFLGHIVFQPGALPKAKQVRFSIGLRAAKEPAAGNGGDCFDLGLGNLRSLREVLVAAIRWGEDTEQVEDALEDALMHAIWAHPNCPSHQLITVPDMKRLMISLPAAIPNYGRMSERWSMAGDLLSDE
uniref:Disease resistance protein RPP13 n=4 Tax=Aegilops tauschii TaxID=37682 RepID=A0A453A6L9_AEGTS